MDYVYILIAFLYFFFNFQQKDPAGSVKHKINLVWPTGAQCSFARDGPLSDPESHGSVSSVAQSSFAGDDSFSGLVYTLCVVTVG